jgi:hypothetical protein
MKPQPAAIPPATVIRPMPTFRLGDYYVREVRRSGEQRRSVYLDVVGTGRTMRVGRREFERKAKPA